MTAWRKVWRCSMAAAALGVSVAVMTAGVSAKEFRWASTTDPQTMDPHAVNSAPVLGFLNNIYEGLVRRGKDMAIQPALAERWEPLGEDGWRFHLRRGVTFHDGAAFDADDVLFSFERANSEQSDTRSWFAPVREVRVVDEATVDFLTHAPNPIFPDSIANFMIMDRGWAEANGAERPARDEETVATRAANGTGAFRLAEREPGTRTVLEPFDGWWGTPEHNITSAVFTPIENAATALAALLSNEVDLINPVPIQDVERLKSTAGVTVHEGIEARVIMLGFAHQADALKYADPPADSNPLTDARVRKAVYQAINADAIIQTIMRGQAQPASQLVSPAMRGYTPSLEARLPYDPDAAKALLAEAGYADGFSFGLMCPNDRYINDEGICQAVVGMLAQVGVTANLTAMPVRNYWGELREGNFDMYLLGWSPGTFDAEHPIRFLASTPNEEKKLGSWNFGQYSNARVDELLPQIQREIDDAKRQAMIDEVHAILQDEVAYVTLHVQPLLWGSRENITLAQRPDNFLILRWITVN